MEASSVLRFRSRVHAEKFKKKLVFAYLVYKYSRRKTRRYWVHPFNSERRLKGAFTTMMIDLREDETKFFDYFHMSIKSFDELAARTKNALQCSATAMREPVSALEMLTVAIRYFGSGCCIKELHNTFRLGDSTLRNILRKVCAALWVVLEKECFPSFTPERWLNISSKFSRSANFPHCVGAVDIKHIHIIKPSISEPERYKFKKFYSLVLFAIADANYNFLYVDVGDKSLYDNSDFYKERLNLPQNEPLPNTSRPNMPYVFVGDEGFELSQLIMRPYMAKLPNSKKIFNYRLSRARRYVDCTFGIFSNKWRIFQRRLDVGVDFAITITKTCCLLHNYVRSREGYNFEDTLVINGMGENRGMFQPIHSAGSRANSIRINFANYFESDAGKVSWQDNCL